MMPMDHRIAAGGRLASALLALLCLVPPGRVGADEFIDLNGRLVPRSQFVVGNDAGCRDLFLNQLNHLHAANGTFVTAVDGTVIFDPAPGGCGFNGDPFTGTPSAFGLPDAMLGASFEALAGNRLFCPMPMVLPSTGAAMNDRTVFTIDLDFDPPLVFGPPPPLDPFDPSPPMFLFVDDRIIQLQTRLTLLAGASIDDALELGELIRRLEEDPGTEDPVILEDLPGILAGLREARDDLLAGAPTAETVKAIADAVQFAEDPRMAEALAGLAGDIAGDVIRDIEDPEADPRIAERINALVSEGEALLDAGNFYGAADAFAQAAGLAVDLIPADLSEQLARDLEDAFLLGAISGLEDRLDRGDLATTGFGPPALVPSTPAAPVPFAGPLGPVLQTFLDTLVPAIPGASNAVQVEVSGGGVFTAIGGDVSKRVKIIRTDDGMIEVKIEEKVFLGPEGVAGADVGVDLPGDNKVGLGGDVTGSVQGTIQNKLTYSFDPRKPEDVARLAQLLVEQGVASTIGTGGPFGFAFTIFQTISRLVSGQPNLVKNRVAAGVKGQVEAEATTGLKLADPSASLQGVGFYEDRPQSNQFAVGFAVSGEASAGLPDGLPFGFSADANVVLRVVIDRDSGRATAFEIKIEGKVSDSANLAGPLGIPNVEALGIKRGTELELNVAVTDPVVVGQLADGLLKGATSPIQALIQIGTVGASALQTNAHIVVNVEETRTVEVGGEGKVGAGVGVGLRGKAAATSEVTRKVFERKPTP